MNAPSNKERRFRVVEHPTPDTNVPVRTKLTAKRALRILRRYTDTELGTGFVTLEQERRHD